MIGHSEQTGKGVVSEQFVDAGAQGQHLVLVGTPQNILILTFSPY